MILILATIMEVTLQKGLEITGELCTQLQNNMRSRVTIKS